MSFIYGKFRYKTLKIVGEVFFGVNNVCILFSDFAHSPELKKLVIPGVIITGVHCIYIDTKGHVDCA